MKKCTNLAIIIACTIHVMAVTAIAQTHVVKQIPNSLFYWEYLPKDYSDPNKKFPLLIFFHGYGERSDPSASDQNFERKKVLKHGPPNEISNGKSMCFEVNGVTECFIVISPQLTTEYEVWGTAFPNQVLNHIIATYGDRIDQNKIYLTGLSLGGRAAIQYVETTYPLVAKIAAIAPFAGSGSIANRTCNISNNDIAVWAFHGEKDNITTPIKHMRDFIARLNGCTPAPNPAAILTAFKNHGHDGWEKTYKTDHTYFNPNVYEWLLKNSIGNPGEQAPTLPVVFAGSDVQLGASQTSITLKGSVSQNDGSEANYTWTQQSGPITTLSNINSNTLTVSGLTSGGEYVFRLTTTSSWGITAYDEVKVTVQSAQNEYSYLQFTAVNGVSSNASGKRIELYADHNQGTGVKVKDIYTNRNTHLQLYIKSFSQAAANLSSILIGVKANYQNAYKAAGDYVQNTTEDGWTRISIPLADFGISNANWQAGVLNVGFKIAPYLGNGTIVFGVDEIHFTGGTSPYVWYGDINQSRGGSASVYELDPTKFYISARSTTDGLSGSASARHTSSEIQKLITIDGPNDYHIKVYNIHGYLIASKTYHQQIYSDINLRQLVDQKGLYVLHITNSTGETDTKKIFIEK